MKIAYVYDAVYLAEGGAEKRIYEIVYGVYEYPQHLRIYVMQKLHVTLMANRNVI